MKSWIPEKDALKRPRYRSLMEAIEDAISQGALKPGDRLPTHRELSFRLGLSVQTVSRAYARLVEAGHIVGEVGRGSFVRSATDDSVLPFPALRPGVQMLDLAILKPVVGDIHKTAMRSTLRYVAEDLPDEILSSFRSSSIATRNTDAVDTWLMQCGVSRDHSDVVPTNGNTSAMTVALMSVAHSGDLIVTESMGHHTLPALCRSLGLRLRGLTVDSEGILPDALDQICRAEPVKALFVMPRCGPLSCVMGADRRQAIAELARRHDFAIIENDGWGPLDRSSAPTPIAALAPERCYYFTSLTKCLLPGLRVGFLVVPTAAAAIARERHMVTNWMVTPLMHEIAARWFSDGTARTLCDWQHAALQSRSKIAQDVLSDFKVRVAQAGLQVWLPCPSVRSEARLVARAREAGIIVAPGSTFSIGPLPSTPGVRISLGVQDTGALRNALHVIGGIAAKTGLA